MRIALVLGVILAAAPAARAGGGKPTAAQAKKAAQAWMTAMTGDDPESTAARAKALTATPFFSVGLLADSDEHRCEESTATDAAALDKRLECLRGNLSPDGTYQPQSSKLRHDEPFIDGYEKQLDKLAKNGTVVVLYQPCEGVFNIVMFVTVKDAGAVKVSAVIATHGACGD